MYITITTEPTITKKELIGLPFFGKFSMNLRTCLYKSVIKTLPQCNKKTIFQSKNQYSDLLEFEDSIPYIFASTSFTNFSVEIAILSTMTKLDAVYSW